MEVKPGYKQTEVGVIPENWQVKSLADAGQIRTGPFGTLLKAEEYYASEGSPLVSVRDIGEGVLTFDERTPLVPPDVVRRLPQYVLNPGDIVFGRKGGVERSAMVSDDQAGCFLGSDGMRIRPSKDFHAQFLAYQLQRGEIQAWLLQNATGTTMASMNQGILRRVALPFPPLPEQRAIAGALGDVDTLLGSLDRLIAKKRDLKQAAMQELLTAQIRLPGFHGEWDVKRLGDIGKFLKGLGIKKDEVVSDGLPCIRYGEIYTHHNDHLKVFNSFITPATAKLSQRIENGDLLFAGSGETVEEIGKCVAFLGDEETYAGGDIVILRSVGQDSKFLGYLMNHPSMAGQKARMGQGEVVVHISAKNLARLELHLPPKPEQSAIAEVLSDMDSELAALEQRRATTAALKQGMMQELLTGRIRLVSAPTNIVPLPKATTTTSEPKSHNWQINEAVVIAVLTKQFGTEKFPLGRKRYTKLSYLLHRHVEHEAEGYLKKAAGPYNPATKYKGPEAIAQRNNYIRAHSNPPFSGFVAADQIAKADAYFQDWYGPDVLQWLEQFRFKSNDGLELLATVDMAMEDLRKAGSALTLPQVRNVIHDHPEWEAKLSRPIFSDENIMRAMASCKGLFDSSGGCHSG